MEAATSRTGPKEFFLWLGTVLSFYVSVISLLNLFFNYINRAYPDALAGYGDPYSSSTRFSIAALVVLFPLFLVLMRLIRKDIAAHPEKRDLWVRKWALGFTLFIAGITMATDLVLLLNAYLNGEVTARFILKALVVFLVAGAAFLHFLADLWGYWASNLPRARAVAIAAATAVFATVLAGFFIIGTPQHARLVRFDDQKVSDLQSVQWFVVNYWQNKGKLPAALSDLNNPISGYRPPVDSQTGVQYGYQAIGKTSFVLCAVFNDETQPNSVRAFSQPVPASVPAGEFYPGKDLMSDTWEHTAGKNCFLRSIDPARYPVNTPLAKPL
ncbi:MAG: hypothetical protein JO026_01875 [Patescibacteria group bacterium]|nr:hypothetical protein [Patescibacteria group bacterium]